MGYKISESVYYKESYPELKNQNFKTTCASHDWHKNSFMNGKSTINRVVAVIPAPWGAWALMPPSYWSLWPQGGGNDCPLVRHLCPLGRDHDDPFHVSLDMPGHVTTADARFFKSCLN